MSSATVRILVRDCRRPTDPAPPASAVAPGSQRRSPGRRPEALAAATAPRECPRLLRCATAKKKIAPRLTPILVARSIVVMNAAHPTAANHNASPVLTGAMFDRNRDVVDVAKLVRADIKQAVATGAIPAAKYSVTVDRYSMGRSVTVTVSSPSFRVYNPARLAYDLANTSRPMTDAERCWMSAEASDVAEYLEAILANYNENRSRPEEDYYDISFAADVRINGDRAAEVASMLAMHAEMDRRAAKVSSQGDFLSWMGVA